MQILDWSQSVSMVLVEFIKNSAVLCSQLDTVLDHNIQNGQGKHEEQSEKRGITSLYGEWEGHL